MIVWTLNPLSSVQLRGSPPNKHHRLESTPKNAISRRLKLAITWTDTQYTRLIELDATEEILNQTVASNSDLNSAFQKLENTLVKQQKQQLEELRQVHHRPQLCRLETNLVNALTDHNFVQVTTPTILSRNLLSRMSITEDHPLNSQIYWLEKDKCLRPMLAPHLYYVMKDLLRLWEKPVRIFEIGSCFRKESEGARHTNEFTMLNLCEFGLPEENRQERLEELAGIIMGAAEIKKYDFETESSTVYGSTLDVVTELGGGLELGSGAMGPHPLDRAWKITDTWVGIGFGLERLLMARKNSKSLGRYSRSISYLDGARLNL